MRRRGGFHATNGKDCRLSTDYSARLTGWVLRIEQNRLCAFWLDGEARPALGDEVALPRGGGKQLVQPIFGQVRVGNTLFLVAGGVGGADCGGAGGCDAVTGTVVRQSLRLGLDSDKMRRGQGGEKKGEGEREEESEREGERGRETELEGATESEGGADTYVGERCLPAVLNV